MTSILHLNFKPEASTFRSNTTLMWRDSDHQLADGPYPFDRGLGGLLFSNLVVPPFLTEQQTPPPSRFLFPASYRNNNSPPPLRCNLGVYPLARRTGTQTHRSLLCLQAHSCSQYSARTLSNRHRYMQVIRETVNAPGCVTSVFQPGTKLKTHRTA